MIVVGTLRRAAGGHYACGSSGSFLGREQVQVASSHCERRRGDSALLQFAEGCGRTGASSGCASKCTSFQTRSEISPRPSNRRAKPLLAIPQKGKTTDEASISKHRAAA